MKTLAVVAVVLFAVTGCGAGGSPCEHAVRDAAAISGTEDSASILDEAITKCGSLQEFSAATDQFPDALDGADALTFVTNRCAHEPSVASSSLCDEVAR